MMMNSGRSGIAGIEISMCINCDKSRIENDKNLKFSSEGVTFCRECGTKIKLFADWTNRCRDCVSFIKPGDNYCWKCGKSKERDDKK
jgi:hypothetical protein